MGDERRMWWVPPTLSMSRGGNNEKAGIQQASNKPQLVWGRRHDGAKENKQSTINQTAVGGDSSVLALAFDFFDARPKSNGEKKSKRATNVGD